MAYGKWIGGFLGFITHGPLGALAGFALGALFDRGLDEVNQGESTFDGDGAYPLRKNSSIVLNRDAKLRESAIRLCSHYLFLWLTL